MVASQTWRLCREGNRPPGLSRRPMASLEAFRVAEEIFGPTWRKTRRPSKAEFWDSASLFALETSGEARIRCGEWTESI